MYTLRRFTFVRRLGRAADAAGRTLSARPERRGVRFVRQNELGALAPQSSLGRAV